MVIKNNKRWSLFLGLVLAFNLFGSGCAEAPVKKRELTSTEKARLQVEIANGALVEGDPTGALQSLALAESEDPNLPELHHSRAIALYSKKDIPHAIDAARRAIQIKPDYPEANNTLGKLLLDRGRYEESVPFLLKAANNQLYRDAYKAWTNLGILKYRKGEFIQSEAFLNRAIQDSPTNSCIAYHYRGHLRLKEKRFADAVRDYDLATRHVCARYGEAQLSLGIAYEQSKQFRMAKKTYLEVQKRYPNTQLAEKALEHLRYLP
jgi:Tfp pilus assembly protein PilF